MTYCYKPVRRNGADELGATRGSGVCVRQVVIGCTGTAGGVPTDESEAMMGRKCVNMYNRSANRIHNNIEYTTTCDASVWLMRHKNVWTKSWLMFVQWGHGRRRCLRCFK